MVKINQSLSKEKTHLEGGGNGLFLKKGYSQATLDEVIKIADTGKGTVYKYYQNKENLFYTLISAKKQTIFRFFGKKPTRTMLPLKTR